ncbi:MAG: hypothetical protein GY801_21715 [bacterium]|nr:hypothetical protein [bacterium]
MSVVEIEEYINSLPVDLSDSVLFTGHLAYQDCLDQEDESLVRPHCRESVDGVSR